MGLSMIIGAVFGAIIALQFLLLALVVGAVRKLRIKVLAEEAENARLRITHDSESVANARLLAAAVRPFNVTLSEDGCLKIAQRLVGAIETLWVSSNERPN